MTGTGCCCCASCGSALHAALSWTRLLKREPEVVAYPGRWGVEDYLAIGGSEVIDVRCAVCGAENTVGRYWPVAAA